jgi:hypothetical protein
VTHGPFELDLSAHPLWGELARKPTIVKPLRFFPRNPIPLPWGPGCNQMPPAADMKEGNWAGGIVLGLIATAVG